MKAKYNATCFWVEFTKNTPQVDAPWDMALYYNGVANTSVLCLFPGTLKKNLYWRQRDQELRRHVRSLSAALMMRSADAVHTSMSNLNIFYQLNYTSTVPNPDDLL